LVVTPAVSFAAAKKTKRRGLRYASMLRFDKSLFYVGKMEKGACHKSFICVGVFGNFGCKSLRRQVLV